MTVATERLTLTALNHRELMLYLSAGDRYEEEKGLLKTGREVREEVKDGVEKLTLPAMGPATGDTYLFSTFWIVVEKRTHRIVAELGFKGAPDAYGEIEIGYGTLPGQEGKGFMTEAVKGILGWAALHPAVRAVLAETDENNPASIRVVEKNGFRQFNKKGSMLWWRKLVRTG